MAEKIRVASLYAKHLDAAPEQARRLRAEGVSLRTGPARVAMHRRWSFLTALAAAGTVFMQIGWADKFFTAMDQTCPFQKSSKRDLGQEANG
jgi:hypothetical protein